MISSECCKRYLSQCQELGSAPGISIRRATAVMAVCRAWVMLGREVAHYHAVVKHEEPRPRRAVMQDSGAE
jgi:hypothetical protein